MAAYRNPVCCIWSMEVDRHLIPPIIILFIVTIFKVLSGYGAFIPKRFARGHGSSRASSDGHDKDRLHVLFNHSAGLSHC